LLAAGDVGETPHAAEEAEGGEQDPHDEERLLDQDVVGVVPVVRAQSEEDQDRGADAAAGDQPHAGAAALKGFQRLERVRSNLLHLSLLE